MTSETKGRRPTASMLGEDDLPLRPDTVEVMGDRLALGIRCLCFGRYDNEVVSYTTHKNKMK